MEIRENSGCYSSVSSVQDSVQGRVPSRPAWES